GAPAVRIPCGTMPQGVAPSKARGAFPVAGALPMPLGPAPVALRANPGPVVSPVAARITPTFLPAHMWPIHPYPVPPAPPVTLVQAVPMPTPPAPLAPIVPAAPLA